MPEQLKPLGITAPTLWGLSDHPGPDGVRRSSNTGPLYAADPWDTFFVDDFQFPGTCELRGVGACHEFRSKKGVGVAGSQLTVDGYKPQPFEVAVEIATADQFDVLIQ